MSSGKSDQMKGRVKEAAGVLAGDKKLERKGQAQQAVGKAEQAVGKAKQQIKKAVDKTKRALD
jgi:uncharacterized protein YjbJ (UPF0337 family)